MERETIEYRGAKYHRYPKSPLRQRRVYFHRHTEIVPFPLHRQIWIDNFGKIPKGFCIHHKDENPLNNEISNLELISKSKHARMHASQPHRIEMARKNLELAREKAILWHRSPAGSELGKRVG